MSAQEINLILHLTLAVLYLPVLVMLLARRAGQERAALWLAGYVLIALLLDVGEGLWRGGQLQLATQPQVRAKAQRTIRGLHDGRVRTTRSGDL